MKKPPYPLLGVNFKHTDRKTVCFLKKHLSSKSSKHPICVYTPNSLILSKASESPRDRAILNRAHILLPDGIGIIIAARIMGYPIKHRITGIDTAEELLSYGSDKGLSFFLLGGKPCVAIRAAASLKRKYPNLKICGCEHGYFQKNGKENQRIINKINSSGADILFVCMGYPTQERWIDKNLKALTSPRLVMGLGGSLDVWSGSVKRAPDIMKKTGTEWLWRALCEPRRFRDIASIPPFLAKIVIQKIKST